MSTATTVEASTSATRPQFAAAKDAAKLVGYTPDYVGRLAREGKVQAELRGRQWFVDVESLKLFSLQAEAERRERQVQLKQQRIEERQATKVRAQNEVVISRLESAAPLALVQGVAVFACVSLLLLMGWVSVDQKLNQASLAVGIESITDSLQSLFAFSIPSTTLDTTKPEQVITSQSVTQPANGLVIFDGSATAADVAAVRNSFSDEVVVSFEGEDTGVITPVFKNPTDQEYRFLLVPVVPEEGVIETSN